MSYELCSQHICSGSILEVHVLMESFCFLIINRKPHALLDSVLAFLFCFLLLSGLFLAGDLFGNTASKIFLFSVSF